ncbi:MAG: ABC transporter permease [Actinobacteria bacterium]|nr:ABC transporter permease [Actinomycetota bacterium]
MSWRDTWATALHAVRAHRLRSALTMLGILIGISAVILTVGIGQGAKATVRDRLNALGTNVLVVSPGSTTSQTGVRGGFGSASTLTTTDASALSSPVTAPDVQAVAPVATSSTSLTFGSTNWTTTLTGTTRTWQQVRSRAVSTGRFLSAADVRTAANVVVLGSDTTSELFGRTSPVGEQVIDNGTPLTVIGVLADISSTEQTSDNDVAIVPLTTYQQKLVGGANRDSVSQIVLKATKSSTLSAAYQETDTTLSNIHGITDAANADFSIATQQSLLGTTASVDNTMTVMLAGIAVISLLVGGIGVMNIMLVSVNERTREIGLRKAVGARPGLIRRQFLLEATVLGLAGGAVGVVVGLVGGVLISHLSSNQVIVEPIAVVGSLVIAVGIGVLFGVYPASRASRLTPIDALRTE